MDPVRGVPSRSSLWLAEVRDRKLRDRLAPTRSAAHSQCGCVWCWYGFQRGDCECRRLGQRGPRGSRQRGRLAPRRLPLRHRSERLPEELNPQFGALCCGSLAGQELERH